MMKKIQAVTQHLLSGMYENETESVEWGWKEFVDDSIYDILIRHEHYPDGSYIETAWRCRTIDVGQ